MRVSTTVLESFRLWSNPEQEWMSEDELLATIRGEFHPTPKMLLGQAFGRALEKPDRWRVEGGYEVFVKDENDKWKPYFFSDADMAPALLQFDRRGVFEVKHVKTYGDVDVVAKADQILGTRINETKTKIGQFDFDKYADSYQWRFLLDIFGASAVTYNVFVLRENGDDGELVKSVETFSVHPYRGLSGDCYALLDDFTSYVTRKGLVGLLQERQKQYS